MRHSKIPLLAVIVLGVLVRLPFWMEAWRTPLDGDEAIIGLMARHPTASATTWGQPFGAPVEPLLAAPLVALMGPRAEPIRLTYFILGLLVIPLAYRLGGALDRRAALPAALLAACPPPYLLVVGSLATAYPTLILSSGALLVLTLSLSRRLGRGEDPRWGAVAWGVLAGLGVWNHLVCAAVVTACAAYLVLTSRPRVGLVALALAAMAVTASPWLVGGDGPVLRIVRTSAPGKPFGAHLAGALPNLQRALGGVLGGHTPLVVDDPTHVVEAPVSVTVVLGLACGLSLLLGLRTARLRSPEALLLLAMALVVLLFPFPQRSAAHTTRYLTPLFLPFFALAARGWSSLGGARAVWLATACLAGLNLAGARQILGALQSTSRDAAPFCLPDLSEARRELEARGIRRAYASYGPAYRLTYASGERIRVTQPWNERFAHHVLPYLDDVRFAKDVAWILTPAVPSDLPSPEAFEAALAAAGGRFERAQAGPAVVYYGFVPPVASDVVPLGVAHAAGDGDPGTAHTAANDQPLVFRVVPPRALDAVTLVAGPGGLRLPRSLEVAVSSDGLSYDAVARRHAGRERTELRWVNGHPQFSTENDLLLVPFEGRVVRAIRVRPLDARGWSLGEVLLHPSGPEGASDSWGEWLTSPRAAWRDRDRALLAHPKRAREDWYYRRMLAIRNVRG